MALVVGRAGCIGSHLVDRLTQLHHAVTIVDRLVPEVHGRQGLPGYVNRSARSIRGGTGKRAIIDPFVADADIIYHLGSLTALDSPWIR